MDLMLLDVETSGLDPATEQIVECATAIYSVEHRTVVKVRSWLVQSNKNGAVDINGLPVELLSKHPHVCIPELTNTWVGTWSKDVDAIVAHNGHEFDRKWFSEQIQERPWVDSMELEWPRPSPSRGLTAIALAHGVGIASAHRALDDVMTLARLFERAAELGADVPAMIARGLRPRAKFAVAARGFDEARNALAKQHGFRFETNTKSWVRTMARDDAPALPFAVDEVAT